MPFRQLFRFSVKKSLNAATVLLLLLLQAGLARAQCPEIAGCEGITYIKVNMHFMLLDDGSGNFNEISDGRGNPVSATYGPDATAYTFAQDLITEANNRLAENVQMEAIEGYTPPEVCPIKYRYVLAGVYLHRDSRYYYFRDTGPEYNQESLAWMNTFGENKKEEINIFSMFKTIANTGGIASGAGCTTGNCWVKLVTPWADDIPTHTKAVNLNHEIAHLLGLLHVFQYDYCDDTPTTTPFTTLNIMDYCKDYSGARKCAQAATPCQLTRMYKHLASLPTYTICSDSIPAVALYSLPQQSRPGTPVYLDGSWRSPENRNENSFSIRIFETDKPGGTAMVGNIYTYHFDGQYDKINLSDFFDFEADSVYSVSLTAVGASNTHTSTKYVSTRVTDLDNNTN